MCVGAFCKSALHLYDVYIMKHYSNILRYNDE